MKIVFLAPFALPSSPWTYLVDVIFFCGISALFAWYYYSFLKKDILGKFWGAALVAGLGALIIFSTMQTVIREVIIWLMSPRIGTMQLSNVNLIAISIGAYLALYIMNQINHNKERRD